MKMKLSVLTASLLAASLFTHSTYVSAKIPFWGAESGQEMPSLAPMGSSRGTTTTMAA